MKVVVCGIGGRQGDGHVVMPANELRLDARCIINYLLVPRTTRCDVTCYCLLAWPCKSQRYTASVMYLLPMGYAAGADGSGLPRSMGMASLHGPDTYAPIACCCNGREVARLHDARLHEVPLHPRPPAGQGTAAAQGNSGPGLPYA